MSGRVALVTGGTSGIGRACVARLRADGFAVTFTGRDAARGAAVAAELGATFAPCDSCDRSRIAETVRGLARLDALVLNAGAFFTGSIAETPPAAFRELIEVNLTAGFLFSRAALPALAAARGSIVHVASAAATRGSHLLAAYSVSKAGVLALSELLAAEGGPCGIRSNAICPGNVLPGMPGEDSGAWQLPPLRRHGSPQDVADAVAWLCSPSAGHVSGATILLDGGMRSALRAGADPLPSA